MRKRERARHIESVIREGGEQFRTVFAAGLDCAFIKDGDMRYTWINPAMENLLDLTASVLIGKTDRELFGDETGDHIETVERRVLGGEIVEDEHAKPVRNAPVILHVINVPIRGSSGEIAGICGIARDISEKKRAEEELRRSEERYRLLFENIQDVYYEAAMDGAILEVSPSIETVSGYKRNELMGRSVYDLYADPDARDAFLVKLRKSGRVMDYEIVLKDRDGNAVPCAISAKIISDETGAGKIAGSLRDISERKEAERKIRVTHEQLQLLTSQLIMTEARERQQIATALHDNVAQTLAMAKMRIQSLQESAAEAGLSEPLNEIYGMINQAIRQTRSLMIDLSPPVLYEFGLDAALEQLAEEFQAKHNIDVAFESRGDLAVLSKDIQILLFQATRELLMNVVKHAQADSSAVHISLTEDEARIEVKDNGIGFPVSETEPLTEHRTGGFGLFSIRERLNHFGGRLDIQSSPGQGTLMTMTMPLKTGPKRRKTNGESQA